MDLARIGPAAAPPAPTAGGDGARHAAPGLAPRLVVPDPDRAADAAWSARADALFAEARAALRAPLSGPASWSVL